MAGTQAFADGGFELGAERGRERGGFGRGDYEEEDCFVGVVWAAAAYAEGVGEEGVEGGRFDDGVDFAAAEADAGGVFLRENVVSIGNYC